MLAEVGPLVNREIGDLIGSVASHDTHLGSYVGLEGSGRFGIYSKLGE